MTTTATKVGGWARDQMTARAAAGMIDGEYPNMGIVLPTIPGHLDASVHATLHSENRILGTVGYPIDAAAEAELREARA